VHTPAISLYGRHLERSSQGA